MMLNTLIQKGFRRSRMANRLGLALLAALAAVLVISIVAGIHSLGAA